MTQSFSPAFSKGKPRVQEDLVALWFGVDVHLDSIRNSYDYLQRKNTVPHILWHPEEGQVLFPVPMEYTGTMWGGDYAVCVAVICDPEVPFTSGPMAEAEVVLEALRFQGIPNRWPMGPPSFSEHHRTVHKRLKPGHYSIDQILQDARGVGSIDVHALFRAGTHA